MRNFIISVLFFFIGLNVFGQSTESEKARAQIFIFNEVEIAVHKTDLIGSLVLNSFDVDRVTQDSIFLYLNSNSIDRFVDLNLKFRTIERKPIIENPKLDNAKAYITSDFNTYPTYNQYDSIMMDFAATYPSICRYVVLGTLPSGRKIIALKISDNVNQRETESSVLYTSSIHGNELAGYIFMLKYIKFLLEGYGVNADATALVDSLDIWINPLANPDGAYYGGNNTVNQSTRYNANSVDLNRNYPDPSAGPHPDGKQYQAETMIFMGLVDTMDFVIAANFHGGAEVINYPWDTWSKLHADDSWWIKASRKYADSVHIACNNNGYLNDLDNGITNGFQWYFLYGGRQDFMNYFHHCREVTMEISATKLLPENQLNTYWLYNKQSLIDYLKNAFFGLKGTITDSLNNAPIRALIEIQNHDIDSSQVWSNVHNGYYHRMIDSGYYSIKISSTGYYSKIIDSVFLTQNHCIYLDVKLKPIPDFIKSPRQESTISTFPNPADDFITVILPKSKDKTIIKVFNVSGYLIKEMQTAAFESFYSFSTVDLPNGVYFLSLSDSCSQKPIFKRFTIKH
jgi:hypothetical protein